MKIINNKDLYELLHIINNNGNIDRIIRKGYGYEDISNNIENLISEKVLESINNEIQLSNKGKELFKELSINYKNKDKDKWIEKELKSKQEKLNPNFIYLPKQDELDF